MGYISTVSGEVSIKPPLSQQEISEHPIAEYFEIDEDGSHIRIDDGEGKYYTLQEDLERFVKAFPTHVFSGTFEVFGEDSTDIWRLIVSSRIKEIETTVTREEATIRWPDGKDVESRY